MAYFMIKRFKIAARHLVVLDGKVDLADAPGFTVSLESAKAQHYEARVKMLQTTDHNKRATQKIQSLLRLCQLWIPMGKCLLLQGVRLPSGLVARDPAERDLALGNAWAKQYARPQVDVAAADDYLVQHVAPWDGWPVAPPSAAQLLRTAQRSRNSKPGKDGLPYAAWATCEGADTLHGGMLQLIRGEYHLISFNDAVGVPPPPKGNEATDSDEVVRSPDNTRPLSMKTGDNKIICAAVNNLLF